MTIYKVYYEFEELIDYDRNSYQETESHDDYSSYHLSYEGAEAHIKNGLKLELEDMISKGYPAGSYTPTRYCIREIILKP